MRMERYKAFFHKTSLILVLNTFNRTMQRTGSDKAEVREHTVIVTILVEVHSLPDQCTFPGNLYILNKTFTLTINKRFGNGFALIHRCLAAADASRQSLSPY